MPLDSVLNSSLLVASLQSFTLLSLALLRESLLTARVWHRLISDTQFHCSQNSRNVFPTYEFTLCHLFIVWCSLFLLFFISFYWTISHTSHTQDLIHTDTVSIPSFCNILQYSIFKIVFYHESKEILNFFNIFIIIIFFFLQKLHFCYYKSRTVWGFSFHQIISFMFAVLNEA